MLASRRKHLIKAASLGLGLGVPALAHAAWPERPIRIVVPYAAGGAADNTARLLAPALSERLKTPVVVDNKPGASGTIGAATIAKAPADGHHLLLDASFFTVNPALLASLPYDPVKDFAPLSQLMQVPLLLVVPASSPFASPQDLIQAARKAPGRLNYASAGNGGAQHLAAELFKQGFKLFITHLPYRGGAPALADLVAGQSDLMFSAMSACLPLVRAGKLRALAVTSAERSPLLPQVPTIAASGLPAYAVHEWNGLWAPAGLPAVIAERVTSEVRTVLASSEIQRRMRETGAMPLGTNSTVFKEFIRAEMSQWASVISKAGIKPD